MLKVGIIGAGGIAEAHAAAYALLPQAQVTAVVDIRPERAEFIARKFGARTYNSVEKLLVSEQLDMVDICTPSFLHKEMAILFLEHGLHVLCEKPIARALADAQAMVEAANRNQCKFMIAQVIRFWPEYVYLKQSVDDGRYGKLVQASFSRICGAPVWAWEGWYVDDQCSGQAPYELGIHDTDFICHLLGKPQAVRATGLERNELTASYLRTQFLFPDGPQVEAEAAWYAGAVPFKATYRAVFEQGILVYDGETLQLYQAGMHKAQPIKAQATVSLGSTVNLTDAGPFYNEIAYFVDCVITDRFPTIITPQDSLNSLSVLLAALQSAKTGEIVELK
jgi:predicted dehydrogenase